MKIVCDNCATKYSIADEKVQGKVFKIKCKKCSHIIVVRGTQNEPQQASGAQEPYEDPATTVGQFGSAAALVAPDAGAPSGDAIWHLVIDREQVGPLSATEVRAKFSSGAVDVETYAWREGFGDWLRLGSIEDFKDLQGSLAPAAPARNESTARTDPADLFGAPDDSGGREQADPGDLFGSAPAPTTEAQLPMPAALTANGGADDLFSNSHSGGLFGAPTAEPAPVVQAAPAATRGRTASPALGVQAGSGAQQGASAGGEQKMTGQRNENSVLFSLNNLQALASGPSSSAPVSAQPAQNAPRAGYADQQSGGSGLIDIRAMASTLSASSNPSGIGKSDDGPAFSSAPVFSPMAAPILMPAQPTGMPKWMWGVIGLGVVAIIGIGAVIAITLTRKPDVVAAVSPAPSPGGTVVAAVTPTQPTQPGGVVAPPTQPGAQQPIGEAPKPAGTDPKAAGTPEEPKKTAPKAAKGERPGRTPKGDAATKGMTGVVPPPTEKAPPKKKGGDALDALLDGASPAEKPAKRAAAEPSGGGDENLPDQLGKSDIVSVMRSKVAPRVSACFEQFKQPGAANVRLTIGSNGKVSSAAVEGKFAGTPTGACVEKAARGAGFPRFKSASQTIVYPFLLQ